MVSITIRDYNQLELAKSSAISTEEKKDIMTPYYLPPLAVYISISTYGNTKN